MTEQSLKGTDKYNNHKGLLMKYKHFDDILPNHSTDFVMLYFAACHSLHELKTSVCRSNSGGSTCKQAWLFRRVQRKLFQMVAMWKNNK